MGVTQLRQEAGREVLGRVAAARGSVTAGAALPTVLLTEVQLAEACLELAALESQATAWRLALAAEADRRGIAEGDADTGTDAWLSKLTGDRREMLRGGLWLARLLQDKYDATREAFAAGKLRVDQVRVIVRSAERAPKSVTPEQLAIAEASLVAMATGEGTRSGRPMNAKRLRQAARRMFAVISPQLADEHEASELEREERRADAETWLTLYDNGDGTYQGRFVIPELHGRLLRASLERLTSPRRWHRDKDGQQVEDETVPGMGTGLSWAEHNGQAFLELLEHLPTEGHPAGNAATMVVHLYLDRLRKDLGSARLDTGVHISPGEARRLACGAGIIPMVFGGASMPLDLGRERRLNSKPQRVALSAIYDSCGASGCDRPFAWCEIHHIDPWSHGGRTDLDNALPLCGFHHRRADDGRFDLRRHGTGDWRFHRRR